MLDCMVGLQLYSLRDEIEEDFEGTLRTVKEMGYDGVEMIGMYGRQPWEIKEICAEIGLVPLSVFIGVDEIMSASREQVGAYKEAGFHQMVISYLPPEYRYGTPGYDEFIVKVKEMGKYGLELGIPLSYHNHDFEFLKIKEEYVLDLLYREIPPEILKTELDTCWVHTSGENPARYIRKYAGRMISVHAKDCIGCGENFEMRPVGYGELDFLEIIAASKEAGTKWIVVEQDFPSMGKTPLECASMSLQYLKSM